MAEELTIGALARRMVCRAATIRYYEREGLLPAPARSQGNYRLYDRTHIERLSFIRRCRSLDMALDEIRLLLQFRDAPASNCGEVNAVLDEHVRHVQERITDLRRLERQLKDLRKLCATAGQGDCGILTELSRSARSHRKPALSGHIQGAHAKQKSNVN